MVYNAKPIYKWMIWGYPHFRKPPYKHRYLKNKWNLPAVTPQSLHLPFMSLERKAWKSCAGRLFTSDLCDLWHLESWSNSGTPWLQLSFRDGKSAGPSKLQGERVGEKVSLLGTSLPWVSRNAWRPSAGRKRIPAPLAALFPELFLVASSALSQNFSSGFRKRR